MSSAAVVIGASRVNGFLSSSVADIELSNSICNLLIFQNIYMYMTVYFKDYECLGA